MAQVVSLYEMEVSFLTSVILLTSINSNVKHIERRGRRGLRADVNSLILTFRSITSSPLKPMREYTL